MSNFLFAVTERELDPPLIDKLKDENIFVKDYSPTVNDGRTGHYYYEITNEDSPKGDTANLFNKIDEVENAIESLHETGAFRLVVIDDEKGANYISRIQNGEFEGTIEGFPQEKIHLAKTLDRYPQHIESNRIYIVD